MNTQSEHTGVSASGAAAVTPTVISPAAPTSGGGAKRRNPLSRGTRLLPAWLVPFLSLIAVTAFFSLTAGDRFLNTTNFQFLLQQTAIIAIPAFGVTLIIIAGSIDLSVGSVVALSGMVGAIVANEHGIVVGLAAAILAGIAAGFCNGVAFAILKVPSFIVTLGMLSVARGISIKISGAQPENVPDGWLWFGQRPGIYIVFAICFAGTAILLHLTSFGRRTVALGGQERVAKLSGIHVNRVKIALFCFGGLMAAIGGIVLSARVGAATPDAASGFELTAIAAVVLGGTPLTGGIGNVVNTVIGALVLSMLLNGMIILGVSGEVQLITQGIVLVGAVLLSLDRSKIGIIK
ncbi:ABC transporter permease [Nocardioides sp. YIM 152315]|uniref:ABC transporter permease n=1 Tax=Nocardioides sp. YIM 152315 TaxID=3031760 RepID=UPI0023D9E221|nr:ABC transporter permease [Nocardioides sp. YIM 152315]MDF1605821.1 ABC transporter permease [Nocardioides sp. YIM 152315]